MEATETRSLSFALGNEQFAIEIGTVQEVVEWEPLEPVPRAPEFVLGIFNYHGRVVTVIDLAAFFGELSRPANFETRIIVLAGEELSMGFKVDQTSRIESFDNDALKAGAALAPEKGLVKAVVNHEGRLYNVMDVERLLDYIENRFDHA